ncbi:MAG: nicotinate phosphoribosyltransferase [Lentisphaeraceae bacterium]|nr:nicotinate phosphoribosyltransferase [Lentisphaeraceae bacterium]
MKVDNLTLLTDLYQLTMAYGYWKEDRSEEQAVFNLFYRKAPFKGGYAIFCGLEDVLDYLEGFKFTDNEINYLKTLRGNDGEVLFEEDYLTYLADLKLTVTVNAPEEGTVIFPHEPMLRIEGPILQCQLLETALLNIINFQTLIATKAARICDAAEGDNVLEFGLRRAQGTDGALSASRAAFIGGCAATSNVLAGQLYDIPVKGTHAHSWVMCFDDEQEAFDTYAQAMPNNTVLLVDTYNTVEGVKKAIKTGLELRAKGHKLIGIRLDSGDLADLSIKARNLLDEAGFPEAAIVASNDLDEYTITKLKKAGAKINLWGVGTKLVTAYDQPALGGVYKLSAIKHNGEWKHKVKLSEDKIKVSNPGVLQIRRFIENGQFKTDVFYNVQDADLADLEAVPLAGRQTYKPDGDFIDLLKPVYTEEGLVANRKSVQSIQLFVKEQLEMLPKEIRQLNPEKTYLTGLEKNLDALKNELIAKARK